MTNVYSLDGILVFGLLFVCTCAYFKKVPRLKTWLLSEKKGVWGVFYKAAVIGTRLHAAVAIACVVMAFYVLFVKWIPKHPSLQLPTKRMRVKKLSGAWAQHKRAQLKSSKSPRWHHSICPYHMGGEFLMVTNIIYASGTPEGQLPWICVNQSSAESIWCPDKLHPTVIRLHTSCIKTCHLFCSSAHHQDLFKLRLSIHTSWEEREFSRLFFFFSFTVWFGFGKLVRMGGGELVGWRGVGNRSYTMPRKFFGFGNFSFIYPSGNMRERDMVLTAKRGQMK